MGLHCLPRPVQKLKIITVVGLVLWWLISDGSADLSCTILMYSGKTTGMCWSHQWSPVRNSAIFVDRFMLGRIDKQFTPRPSKESDQGIHSVLYSVYHLDAEIYY